MREMGPSRWGKEDRVSRGAYKARADCGEARESPTAGSAEGEGFKAEWTLLWVPRSYGWDHSGHALLSVQ